MSDDEQPFLARWSKRKAQVRGGAAIADPVIGPEPTSRTEASVVITSVVGATPIDTSRPTAVGETAQPLRRDEPPLPAPPTMAEVEGLTPRSDFSRFVGGGVDRSVSNAAMKKLFADPHFNVMDGLDTYIDDYGKPDPIPAPMLRRMVQAQALGLFADEDQDKEMGLGTDARPPIATATPSTETPTPAPEAPEPTDDDADLRLQPDDAARRSGAGAGARP